MRKIITLFVILCLSVSVSYGQLKHWSFNTESNAPTYTAPGTTGSNAVFHGVGTSSFPSPGHNGSSHAYMSDDWTTSATIDATDYLEFTVTATGDNLDFSHLEIAFKRNINGPQNIAVYSDVDGFTTPITSSAITAPDVFQGANVNLNSAAYSNLPSLTIRIYGYNAINATGTLTFDEIAFQTIAVLPVELAYFDAKKVEGTAALSWATYSEFENATYVIGRSSDGLEFETIGVLEGAGTTTAFLTYDFIDKNPMKGTNYYRLEMIDFEGESTFSRIKTVDFKDSGASITLYPNPVVDFVIIDFEEAKERSLTIFNLSGQIVRQIKASNYNNQMIIPTNDLESGQYFVRIQTANNQIITKNFMKF